MKNFMDFDDLDDLDMLSNDDKHSNKSEEIIGASSEVSEKSDNTKVCNNLNTNILFTY